MFTTPWIKRQRDHVAVRNVRDLVRKNRLDLCRLHLLEQSDADGDQGVIPFCTSCERVRDRGVEHGNFGHVDTGVARERATVSSSHCSVVLRGVSMTTAPVDRLAIDFDNASDTNEPPKPNRAEKIVSPIKLRWSTPKIDATTVNSAITAMLVPMRRPIRVAKPPTFLG